MDSKLAVGQNRPMLRAMIRKTTGTQVQDCSQQALALPELQLGG